MSFSHGTLTQVTKQRVSKYLPVQSLQEKHYTKKWKICSSMLNIVVLTVLFVFCCQFITHLYATLICKIFAGDFHLLSSDAS